MGINGLLTTIVQKKQLDLQTAAQKLAQEQLVLAQQGQKAQVFDALSRVLPNLNPEQRQAYSLGIAHASGLDDETATTLAQGVRDSPEAIQSQVLRTIVNDPKYAASYFERVASGRTPLQAQQEGDQMALPQAERTYGAEVRNGTALGAGAKAQLDVGMANVKQNYAALANQWNIAQLEYQGRLATARDPQHAAQLLGSLTSLLKDASAGTNTEGGQRLYNAAINTIIEQLANEGIVVPIQHIDPKTGQSVLGLDPDGDVRAPGFFGTIGRIPSMLHDAAAAAAGNAAAAAQGQTPPRKP